MAQMYNSFRLEYHPELEQPTISNFYDNSSFPDLIQIGQWLKKGGQSQYPTFHIPPVPKDLQSILDSIFNEFGYVPNL